MPVEYRKSVVADVPDVVRFQMNMALETEELKLDRQIVTRGVQGVFEDPTRGQYYVAETDKRVIASTLITYEWSDWRSGTVWWIQSVYVIPEARKQRVYAGLYSYVKQLAEANHDVRGIRLYVDRRNLVAQNVYSRLGMNGDHYQVFEWMKE